MTRDVDRIDPRIRDSIGDGEYSQLVQIWRSAVDATHHFLAEEHRDEIESRLASDYLPHVDLYVAEAGGVQVGFVGVSGGNLEMLFVDAARRGHGIGTALLTFVIAERGVTTVDVNEQNEQAVGFYRHRGFSVVGRSELDDQGRPYPILHLALRGKPVDITALDTAIRAASFDDAFALLRGASEEERAALVKPLTATRKDIYRSLPSYAKYGDALTLADMVMSLVDGKTKATVRTVTACAWIWDNYADALVDRNAPWLDALVDELLATKLPSDFLEDDSFAAGEALRSRMGKPRPATHRYAIAMVFQLTTSRNGDTKRFHETMVPTLEIYRADGELREQLLRAIETTGLVRVTKHWMDTKEESRTRGYPAVVKALVAEGLMDREDVIAAVLQGLQHEAANAASVSLHGLFLEELGATPAELLAAHRDVVERLSASPQKNVRLWAERTIAAASR